MSQRAEIIKVVNWLKSMRLDQYILGFISNDIRWEALPTLTDEDLKECGVQALGHRKQILAAIRDLAPKTPEKTADLGDTPSKLAHFELLEPLGQGGMGKVYRGWDASLSRQVAIKVLDQKLVAENPEFAADFIREAKSAASINNPHIVQIYFAGEQDGILFIAMELLEGQNMAERLERGPMDEKLVLQVARQAVEALAATSARRLIHGDIKPHNIFMLRSGEVKLLDFGLARKSSTGDRRDFVLGSAAYISPERVLQEPEDFRSDIYSLGATLFEAVSGFTPFDAETPAQLATKRLEEDAPPLRSIKPTASEGMERLVARMLARDPNARHESYVSLAAEMMAVQEELKASSDSRGTGLTSASLGTNPLAAESASSVDPQPAQAEPAVLLQEAHHGPRKTLWQRLINSRSFVISICLHVLLGMIAMVYVVQTVSDKRKLTFTSTPPSPNPSQRALEHKVQMAKKQNTMSAPAQARRITTTGLSKVALPDMPAMSTSTEFTPGKMAGMGGTGVGLGFSGGMGAGSGGRGGGIPFFGLRTGNGLGGYFYDLKQTRDAKPSEMTPKPGEKDGWPGKDEPTNLTYDTILHRLMNSGFSDNAFTKYFRGPAPLFTTQIYIPRMPADAAPAAFNLEGKVQGKRWVVLYRGKVIPAESGRYRFVGWADDVLLVRFNGNFVLDGTLMDLTKRPKKREVHLDGMGMDVPASEYFEVRAGMAYSLDIAIGERPGGEFSAFLMLEKEGSNSGGRLPIFKLAPSPMPAHAEGLPSAAADTSWSVWKSQAQPASMGMAR